MVVVMVMVVVMAVLWCGSRFVLTGGCVPTWLELEARQHTFYVS